MNFVPDYKVYDGQFANISWLQELPDPISKMTWDNAAYISPETAKNQNNLQPGDVATLTYGGKTLEVPVWIIPGIADGVVVLPLGYGRTGLFETVAKEVGFNANRVRSVNAPWFDGGAKLDKTPRTHKFSLTQQHWSMEGRPLALDMSVEQFRKELEDEKHEKSSVFARVRGEQASMLGEFEYKDYKWAMAIDRRAARVAPRAWWPASRRTTSPSWARSRWPAAARCSGCASTGTSRAMTCTTRRW
ncbi:hypothetical protein ACN28S_47205 [Cystobacter fuscus]